MQYNETTGIVTDDNGNTASVSWFGSKEAAEAALDTLRNCHNCHNCRYCRYCHNCQDCQDCHNCQSCQDCQDCQDCHNCRYCRNCQDCQDCRNCRNCHNCHNCQDCQISGFLGGYSFWAVRDWARVGCQEYTVDEWLTMDRERVAKMATGAGEWYDLYWSSWTALLEAARHSKGITVNREVTP